MKKIISSFMVLGALLISISLSGGDTIVPVDDRQDRYIPDGEGGGNIAVCIDPSTAVCYLVFPE